ncbi:MAG: imidazolonepropionase [Vulcanisaeta sp.]|jgi:imidazolonepropionase|nr:MAG: imidazolonepropionase [Vulcanisaeta sp. CIS_19]MCG2864890.1 imidazolonepropionase [Vulcanisaeta sp.]MCG2866146.1 imidazolonepropionase [Vulcanisaeta sp.]MCG2885564.1 imidazolonepropionase [Vulcanisaeta sp.]MDT7862910.1 imidazolonepropionase [Vulcanisaeta sp.]
MRGVSLLIGPIGQLVTAKSMPWRYGDDVLIMEDAGIAVDDESIVDVGPWDRISREYDSKCRVPAEDSLVTAGLVDPHTHLLFMGSREDELELKLQGVPYEEILRRGGGIYKTVNATVNATDDELRRTLFGRLFDVAKYGTTTIEVKSGYGLLPSEEVRLLRIINNAIGGVPPDVVPTYLIHVPPRDVDRRDYVKAVIESFNVARGLAKFVDVFCDEGAFTVEETREIMREAYARGFGLRLHADEIAYIGCSDLVNEFNIASMDHLLNMPEKNAKLLSSRGTVATLLPVTVLSLMTNRRPPVKALREAGVPIALGSDFSPNSWSLNMQYAMELATYLLGMTPIEVLMASTVNAAYSLGLRDRGILQPGYLADIVVWDVPNYRWLSYELGRNKVSLVIKRGNILEATPEGVLARKECG